jgi:signal transduction histidine kinase
MPYSSAFLLLFLSLPGVQGKGDTRRKHSVVRRPDSDYVQIFVVGATLTALLVLAVLVVNRESSGAIASDAEVAILSESALSATAAVRNATNFAVVLEVNGVDDELMAGATLGVEKALAELETRVSRLGDELEDTGVEVAFSEFAEATAATLSALEDAGTDSGATMEELVAGYDQLSGALADVRDESTGQILLAGEGVGRAADAVRFMVVFLLPLGIMIGVWRAVRRSATRRILTEELRHEREVSRSKDAFIADVSHELRTPLTGIYGFASALEEDADHLPAASRELVGLIVTEAAELSRMVDDLVAAGRIDAQAITFDIQQVELLPEIQEVLRPFSRRGISVEVDDIAITVLADRMRLRQLLRNLVSNAAKHGGDDVAVTAYTRDGYGVVEVIDDGPGVSEEVEARLFQRYVHADGTAILEGSVGLGLAIARSFAEGMGGTLEYIRTDGMSIFAVSLPLTPQGVAVEEGSELSVVSG